MYPHKILSYSAVVLLSLCVLALAMKAAKKSINDNVPLLLLSTAVLLLAISQIIPQKHTEASHDHDTTTGTFVDPQKYEAGICRNVNLTVLNPPWGTAPTSMPAGFIADSSMLGLGAMNLDCVTEFVCKQLGGDFSSYKNQERNRPPGCKMGL